MLDKKKLIGNVLQSGLLVGSVIQLANWAAKKPGRRAITGDIIFKPSAESTELPVMSVMLRLTEDGNVKEFTGETFSGPVFEAVVYTTR